MIKKALFVFIKRSIIRQILLELDLEYIVYILKKI